MKGRPLILVEALAVHNDSGLGRLARLLADSLEGLAGEADIHLILPRSAAWNPAYPATVHRVSARPFRLWTQVFFPLLIRRLKPAAVLCLGQTLPAWRPAARYALVVPDIGPAEDLGHAASSHDGYNRGWLLRMPPKADRILTIGAFSKRRIRERLGIAEDRIAVVKPIGPRKPDARASRPPPRPGPYILAMGNVEPRKNFPGLIAAYARFAGRHADAPPLVIVGHKAWGFAEAEAAARGLGVEGKVVFTDFVGEPVREAYLAHCSFFVSSSLYEGWGLPLFEALSMGKPAVYHAGTSQDEFARGFALAADCSDAESLAEAMGRLWSDAEERGRLEKALAGGFGAVMDYDPKGALRDALLPLLKR